MRVLNSAKAFSEHYATRAGNFSEWAKATAAGGFMASGMVGTTAVTTGVVAAQTSVWSAFAGWPVIGTFAAGKAAGAGVAAGLAAAGSATLIVPALIVGGGVAYLAYRNRKRKPCQRGSNVAEVANAFAHVAYLPMMARAVSICNTNPANVESVRNYVLKEMGAWGYAESYVQALFDETMKKTAAELNGHYDWAMRQLASGTTEGIGATPEELPHEAVREFADKFKSDFEFCIG